MSDYKLTRHKVPNTGAIDNLEPPAEGYVPAGALYERAIRSANRRMRE